MALRNWRDHLMTLIADVSVFRRQPEVVLWRLCQTSGATETTCSFTEPAPEIFHVLVIFSSRGLGRDARGRVNPDDPTGRSYTARSQNSFAAPDGRFVGVGTAQLKRGEFARGVFSTARLHRRRRSTLNYRQSSRLPSACRRWRGLSRLAARRLPQWHCPERSPRTQLGVGRAPSASHSSRLRSRRHAGVRRGAHADRPESSCRPVCVLEGQSNPEYPSSDPC
jgi:hypothetical protein